MTRDEQAYVVRQVVDAAGGVLPVVAGVGDRSTHEAIATARAMEKAGADALLLVTPPYVKPMQDGLRAHFGAVLDHVSIPAVLYNVPGRTGVDLQPETIAALSADGRVLAVKEATGSILRAAAIRARCPDLALLSGDDATVLPFVAVGGNGTIAVTSNLAPKDMVALVRAVQAGDLATARTIHYRLLPLFDALFVDSNPIPVKTALAWMGVIPSSELRLPLTPVSTRGADALDAALRHAGITFQRRPGEPSLLGPSSPLDFDDAAAPTTAFED